MAKRHERELKNTGYEIFIGFLSVLSIVNIVLVFAFDDPNLDIVLQVMSGLLIIIFLADFGYRLLTSTSRSRYFFRQFGWADLLACVPIEPFKVFRIFRVIRVSHLLREHGTRRILRSLIKDRAGSALLTLLLMGILVLEFGSLAILYIEQDVDGANLTTGGDAIWYVLVTISTVGYGDRYPVTNAGRLVGAMIILVGVGIFGTFTGYLANLFLTPPESVAPTEPAIAGSDSNERIESLKSLVAEQRAALDKIERLLSPPH